MDINIWNILAAIGLVIMSYVIGYYNGKKISSSPDFFKKKNDNPYYNKDTNTYSVPTGGSLEGMPYPHHLDKN